ncbi:MAG: DUF4982 domain-containing protein [Bacteroidaceae bacterium]|nr:DUF4982 domain-containing protein [Bacteroidaceae bacterium]
MKKILTFVTLLGFALGTHAAEPQRKQLFDADWQFSLDSVNWRTVCLPHDWSIEGAFDEAAPAGNDGAYLPTGKGWYKKQFTIDNSQFTIDKKLQLYFEGVYMNSVVYVNGQRAGGHPYGYSSFFVDVTPYIHQGDNTLLVSVDNSRQKNCRWYSGSGIYRHVWLITTEKVHFKEWSSRVMRAKGLKFVVEVQNEDTRERTVSVFGHEATIEPGKSFIFTKSIDTLNLQRWSPEQPILYKERAELMENGRVVDTEEVTYGWRSIEWDAKQGLRLNGKTLKLSGACIHHDNGILGAAAFDAAEYRKVRLLKEGGFNAVRTSHNPPSEAFLRACDELGLLVIDESFDGWREKKNDHDYHELIDQWWKEDLRAMVARDRNHPSIFCWSIGNEVIERKHIGIIKTAHQMAEYVRQLDHEKRPVTSALCAWDDDWDIYDPLAAEHDIVGYNYMMHKAESDHQRVPKRVMVQTESYPRDAWQNYERTMKHPYIVGDFVWTGIDYLGESGIGRWYYTGDVPGEHWTAPKFPWHAAHCGDIDFTGLRKPISHYRSMLWNPTGEQIYMAVREPDGYVGQVKTTMWGTWPTFESWTWPGHEGKPIEVEVYSHSTKVRLYLNNQLVAEKEVQNCMAVFSLPYQPGTLRAETIEAPTVAVGGATTTLRTASEPRAIRLTVSTPLHKRDGSGVGILTADNQDLAYVTVELTDAQGTLNPLASNELTATVKGPATLAAFGNADIKDCDPYSDATHRAWKGRALLVLRSTDKPGKVTLTLQGKGLKTKTLTLTAK